MCYVDANCQENPAYYRRLNPNQDRPETPDSGRSGLATDSVQEREFRNPLYAVSVGQTLDSGRNGLATDSVREREFNNPLYSMTEGRNSTLEATDLSNTYDQVYSRPENVGISPDPSASEVYYSVIPT